MGVIKIEDRIFDLGGLVGCLLDVTGEERGSCITGVHPRPRLVVVYWVGTTISSSRRRDHDAWCEHLDPTSHPSPLVNIFGVILGIGTCGEEML
jgi:hypothetical protein